ncbi:MAG: radical SAM protein [Candidatus Bathyarchaeota archaeon]|nr:radical SAM protein [Candidatus Bathyarchaeota archaeon]
MGSLSADEVWNLNPAQLQNLLDTGSLASKNKTARFYAPSFSYYKTSQHQTRPTDFPTISITGNSCALNCKHCNGIVLQTMHSTTTPKQLLEFCTKIKSQGALGCLISGGCTPSGVVPLQGFVPTIAQIKRDLDLTVMVHTGIIDAQTALQLKQAQVDTALIDVIGSNQTIKQIYNLKVTTADYDRSLQALEQSGIPFVPHIIAGLHHGKLQGELEALKMVSKYKPSAVVIISFMPIHGTAMASTTPAAPMDIAKVTAAARTLFPDTPVVLGCMRPKGKHRSQTDVLALKAGSDAIAFPSQEAIAYAQQNGYQTTFSSYCCAQIYKDLTTKD